MSTNPMVIPESERYGKLKDLLSEYVGIVANIRDANRGNSHRSGPGFFLFLSYPWIVDQISFPVTRKDFLERRKWEITELKSRRSAEVKKRLEEVLRNDKHLAQCCPTLLHLANFLDSFFITAVADARRQGAAPERLDFAYGRI